MRKNIGFLIPSLEHNPIHDKIISFSRYIKQKNQLGETLFFVSSCKRSDINDIPIMHILHSKFFDGTLFLFDIPSILMSKSFPNLKNRYFYTFQTFWSPDSPYNTIKNIILDTSLEIIVSDEHLYHIYDICWKQPKLTAELTDHEKLCSII